MNFFRKKKIQVASLGLLVSMAVGSQLVSCGQNKCTILDQAFREASCKTLSLNVSITANPPAGCTGANWRNLYINCPPATGLNSNCTAISDGFTVLTALVPNNANGNFTDFTGSGVTYTNCSQLLTDITSNLVAGIVGVYVTDGSVGNRLNCDATGCGVRDTSGTHTIGHESAGCFSSWDPVGKVSTGNPAQITAGTQLLACMYIDNTPLATLAAPAVYGSWYGAMPQVTLAGANGAIIFDNTGSGFATWQDAY